MGQKKRAQRYMDIVFEVPLKAVIEKFREEPGTGRIPALDHFATILVCQKYEIPAKVTLRRTNRLTLQKIVAGRVLLKARLDKCVTSTEGMNLMNLILEQVLEIQATEAKPV